MRWQAAADRVTERTTAAAGLPADCTDEVVERHGRPRDFARMLLSGQLDGAELERALDDISMTTSNGVALLATCPEPWAALYCLVAQCLLQGLLVGSHPRGGGASQEPNDEFPGATQ